ncbi:histidine phosphatase superfamily [Coemansia spiralis]|nr:histidine phosphatase superfamily [Coemansia spiralis]
MVQVDIIIARHGETKGNNRNIIQSAVVDVGLNETGKRQASQLSERLRNEKIDWMVASAMSRTMETARAVAKYHPAASIIRDERLNGMGWGDLDGCSIDKCKLIRDTVIKKWLAGDFGAKHAGGESLEEVNNRITSVFTDILKTAVKNNYKEVFVCTHGRLITVIVAALVDKDMQKMNKYKHTNCSYYQIRVDVDRGAIEDGKCDKLHFELVCMDVRDHLLDVNQ